MNLFKNSLKNQTVFEEIYHSDYYELACEDPVPINDEWIVNNWTNNDALDLLNAQCSWTITKGDSNIIVTVIDTEFDVCNV